jgi:hypothetical protein
MEKAGQQRHVIGGGGKKAPALGLQKQNSWSPDIERDEAWERRRRGMRRGGTALRRARSVTDDDLDELRGCIDLGFGFEPAPAAACACACAGRNRLLETLPALDLYYAVHGGAAEAPPCSCGAASEASSSEESPLGSPMSILSPGSLRLSRQSPPVILVSISDPFPFVRAGDTPETVKMRLKQWAQVVALSMLSRH